jgi:hypothetical protein
MNVFMQPLFEELKKLWPGVDAYDSHLKCRFNLRAGYLWSIHDYLAYGKFAGWCVHGRLNYLVCMENSNAFRLEHDRKVSFFDCHRRFLPLNHPFRSDPRSFLKGKTVRKGPLKRKLGADITKMIDDIKESENSEFEGYGEKHNWTHKSCVWELPYAKALILHQNIDLMHQERNVVKSIISMCLDVTGLTKDNMNARKDLADLCDRPSLEARANAMGNLTRPHAPYCLVSKDRTEILKWLKTLKFLDRNVSNIKRVVNVGTGKLNGLKSHDYHIIMERLLPVMFCGYFNADLWKMFTELSYFYMQIWAKQVSKMMMQKFEKEIPVLICKMEKVFPPGWFNAMQHLLVHLPWEARVGGPVQFRWMYSQERELKKLGVTVRNKARVEGCIADAFACKEIMNFSSMYFSCTNNVNAQTPWYHIVKDVPLSELSIFQWKGKGVGAPSAHYVTNEEWNYTMLYMYTNMMEEVEPYFEKFDKTY